MASFVCQQICPGQVEIGADGYGEGTTTFTIRLSKSFRINPPILHQFVGQHSPLFQHQSLF